MLLCVCACECMYVCVCVSTHIYLSCSVTMGKACNTALSPGVVLRCLVCLPGVLHELLLFKMYWISRIDSNTAIKLFGFFSLVFIIRV